MATIDPCTSNDKAQRRASPYTPAKYEPDCAQNKRPGRWWDYVNKSQEGKEGVYKDEDGNYWRWDRRDIREPFSRSPNPRGNLGVYKNFTGCTLYKKKKTHVTVYTLIREQNFLRQ